MKTLFVNMVAVACILLSNTSYGQKLQPLPSTVKLPDDIIAAEDVSAIAMFGSFLVIGSDEGVGEERNKNYIQLLKKGIDHSYEVHRKIFLFKGNKTEGTEMDIEGLAVEGKNIYVVGSHSSKRQKVKDNKKYKNNRENFQTDKIEDERNRDWLYRLTIDSQGKEVNKEKITLREIIENDTVLKAFSNIPSKENGVDIEGLTVKDGWLYIGFRGPVFRENYVPVMKLQFDDPKGTYDLLYIELGGRGIRGMTSVSDGFLIVAGPVGDGPASYQLYHWDGKDVIPGKDRQIADIGKTRLLGDIIPPKNGKSEGVVVIQEEDTLYHLIIVYDGVKNKDNVMQRFRVPVEAESSSNPDGADDATDAQDIEEVVSGLYSWGFEVSDFQPCGVDEKWWVVGSAPELLSRYRGLTSNVYEQVYARLKGIKSAPGHYGHLGAYDRQFEVHEILELRALQNGDCK